MEHYNYIESEEYLQDVREVLSYIRHVLKNPDAADALLIELRAAMKERAKMPKAFKPYGISKETNRVFYYIKVQNFYAFYYLDEKKKMMDFRAFMYTRMNVANKLKVKK